MGTADLCLTPAEEKSILSGKRHIYKSVPCARAWDTFLVDGKRFEIIDVSERSLYTIANKYYPIEGCQSPHDFIRDWRAGHSGDWSPEQAVYVHWFRETGEPGNGSA
ncbi:MAG: hypothetical protein EHM35_08005 [Planctomycetaceae bacterium]|nr:MAG: hypothetical protein EHM35_08005 [Planctomycetaceae bacterium]